MSIVLTLKFVSILFTEYHEEHQKLYRTNFMSTTTILLCIKLKKTIHLTIKCLFISNNNKKTLKCNSLLYNAIKDFFPV